MENDPITQFADALRAAGLVVKREPVMDDKIQRVDVEGKPGGRDGSNRVKTDGYRAYGWFQNWTIHAEPRKWHANGDHRPTREQRSPPAQHHTGSGPRCPLPRSYAANCRQRTALRENVRTAYQLRRAQPPER
jgi:hypothetical protein